MNEETRSIVERELGFIEGLSFGADGDIGEAICTSVEVIREMLQKAGVLYKDGESDGG